MSVEFIDAWDETDKVVRATLGYTSSGKKAFCPDENFGTTKDNRMWIKY